MPSSPGCWSKRAALRRAAATPVLGWANAEAKTAHIMQAKTLEKLAPACITKVVGRQIIDSRGNPTVEADVHTYKGFFRAAVPSALHPHASGPGAEAPADVRRLPAHARRA